MKCIGGHIQSIGGHQQGIGANSKVGCSLEMSARHGFIIDKSCYGREFDLSEALVKNPTLGFKCWEFNGVDTGLHTDIAGTISQNTGTVECIRSTPDGADGWDFGLTDFVSFSVIASLISASENLIVGNSTMATGKLSDVVLNHYEHIAVVKDWWPISGVGVVTMPVRGFLNGDMKCTVNPTSEDAAGIYVVGTVILSWYTTARIKRVAHYVYPLSPAQILRRRHLN